MKKKVHNSVPLPREITRMHLRDVWSQFRSLLEGTFENGESRVELQADCVERIDGPGIQLLLSFQKAAEAKGLRVALINPSPTMRNSIAIHRGEKFLR